MTSRRPPPTSPPSGPDALRSSAVVSRSGGSCASVLSGDELAERLRRQQATLLDLRHRLGDTTGST